MHLSPSLAAALFWLCVAVLAVGQLLVIRSVLSGRAPGSKTAERARRMRAGEIAWTFLPAVMLAVVLAFTWRAVRAPARVHTGAESAEARDALTLLR